MSAVVQVVITCDPDDMAETIGEQILTLNARWWDDSDHTCERILAWLRSSR